MEFTPEQKVLNDLFGNDLTYKIPSYQRPYSWSAKGKSDKDNQVNTMWADLIEHFENDAQSIYFMGSMVLIGESSSRIYDVVDGQQRLTTLTLLFVGIKCMLQGLDDTAIEEKKRGELKEFIANALANIDSMLFNKKLLGVLEKEKKVKVQSIAGFDYDYVLKIALECKEISSIGVTNLTEEQRNISERYFQNRDYFIVKLKDRFLDSGMFTYVNAIELNKFIDFLKNKVTIVRILSPEFDVAYQIFEILNNRGLPLSNKDLFRNFIISELYKAQVQDPEKKWLELDEYAFTSDFVSRYVESKKASKQRYSAFNDLQDIYQNSFEDTLDKPKVLHFYADIKKSLAHFTDIELLSFNNKAIRHRVELLKNAGNSRYIVNLLLTLFKQESDEQNIIRFLSNFELFILYGLLGPSKRFQTKPIFQAIENLNAGITEQAIQVVSLSKKEKDDLSTLIRGDIKDNDWAKLIVARFFWALDIEEDNDVVELNLDYRKATLEHIIPQTVNISTNWNKDFTPSFREQYTYKLGNMTLLTQKMNSKAKNHDFSKKRDVYKKTKLTETSSIGNRESIHSDFFEKRQDRITGYLINHFKL